jgi:hypothetical protein
MRSISIAVLYTLVAIPCGAQTQTTPDASKTPPAANASTSESVGKTEDKSAAQQPPAAEKKKNGGQAKDDVKNDAKPSELVVVGKNNGTEAVDFQYQMGEILQVRATGAQAQKLKTASKVGLYFDGIRLTNLTSTPIEVGPGKEILQLNFHVTRDSATDENRKAWDALFKTKKGIGYLMTVQPAIGAGNDLPVAVQSAHPVQFFVAKSNYIWATLIVGGVVFLVAYWLIVRYTKMLIDAETAYYSLGKSQMAFWGLLVLITFFGVWLLNQTMERIPPQALILLGISAATGLGAVVIGNSKRTATENEIAELKKTEQSLQAANTPESQARLLEIKDKIEKLDKQLEPGPSKGFWRDICNDGNGVSFHRLQVVLWTLVLGVVFVYSVSEVMSMPEFPETLLTLMGISNGTYLGFKIPEK